MLLRLFSGDTDLLMEFARRIADRDISPRASDPISLQIALRAYGKHIANQVDANPERVRRLQRKLLQKHHEQQYEGEPLDLVHC